MVKPGCLRNWLRSARERDGCQVMLLLGREYAGLCGLVGWWGLAGHLRCQFAGVLGWKGDNGGGRV
jgi:hypothetical protein